MPRSYKQYPSLEKHGRIISKLCWDFCKGGYLEFDDCHQDCILNLLSKTHLYNPTRSKASTFVYWITHNHLVNMMRKRMYRLTHQCNLEDHENTLFDPTKSSLEYSLSDKAQEVLRMCQTKEIPIGNNPKPSFAQNAIIKYATKKWDMETAISTLEEIYSWYISL